MEERREFKRRTETPEPGSENESPGERPERRLPTRAAEFLALDLSDAFVCQSARAGAASTAGLDGIGAEVVGQPLQITVTNKRVLGQVTGGGRGRGNKR